MQARLLDEREAVIFLILVLRGTLGVGFDHGQRASRQIERHVPQLVLCIELRICVVGLAAGGYARLAANAQC